MTPISDKGSDSTPISMDNCNAVQHKSSAKLKRGSGTGMRSGSRSSQRKKFRSPGFKASGSGRKISAKKSPNSNSAMGNAETKSEEAVKSNSSNSSDVESFEDHAELSNRVAKSLYFANELPSTSRPSFPLTVLAVKAFTTGPYAPQKQSLEFLDLELAAEIGRNACVSPTALIMALVYLERLSHSNSDYLTEGKPSELFVISLLVASKFIQDDGEDLGMYNDEWATSAKMDLKHINRLEIEFLRAIDWRVNVSREDYDRVLNNVEEKLAMEQAVDRGWFTYTEMRAVSHAMLSWNFVWHMFYEYAFKVVSVATLAYTTLLATIATSSVLGPYIFFLSKALLASTGYKDSPLMLSSSCSSTEILGVYQNTTIATLFHARSPVTSTNDSFIDVAKETSVELPESVQQTISRLENIKSNFGKVDDENGNFWNFCHLSYPPDPNSWNNINSDELDALGNSELVQRALWKDLSKELCLAQSNTKSGYRVIDKGTLHFDSRFHFPRGVLIEV